MVSNELNNEVTVYVLTVSTSETATCHKLRIAKLFLMIFASANPRFSHGLRNKTLVCPLAHLQLARGYFVDLLAAQALLLQIQKGKYSGGAAPRKNIQWEVGIHTSQFSLPGENEAFLIQKVYTNISQPSVGRSPPPPGRLGRASPRDPARPEAPCPRPGIVCIIILHCLGTKMILYILEHLVH